ncbi:MAG TPA: hypothetical protein VFV38_02570 [Ktedonobacteraceae bacterium]|nr:hypothetical protein [Ktedonobacteraceae bacterium]
MELAIDCLPGLCGNSVWRELKKGHRSGSMEEVKQVQLSPFSTTEAACETTSQAALFNRHYLPMVQM